jgi:hypothetical protein
MGWTKRPRETANVRVLDSTNDCQTRLSRFKKPLGGVGVKISFESPAYCPSDKRGERVFILADPLHAPSSVTFCVVW